MKITKTELELLIKEEIEKLIEQDPYSLPRLNSTQAASDFLGEELFIQVMNKMKDIAGSGRPVQKTGYEFLIALNTVLEEKNKKDNQ